MLCSRGKSPLTKQSSLDCIHNNGTPVVFTVIRLIENVPFHVPPESDSWSITFLPIYQFLSKICLNLPKFLVLQLFENAAFSRLIFPAGQIAAND